ncbi:hypothetical protein A2852_02065 [Candidatus Adlerbacteria bacterium RIFCSPHIGHO2_01_FULL_54_23]|uniref:DUF4145 domain-containing protein n=2 Tax=Candidatus Adleribacteriota TaxID=1752736 RepID=A0A0G1XYI3_9BACT|nr:MAG: hypothetical protein UY83_C0002G0112 [Candidatus Adlerbacteria bacterium GW2011_GWA1_54_10]KKW37905.1 MAG: hypothetical protein UY86_C0002G0002 [Candidatus Adlerbacteria bacterium GW2011_GWB1_54_7]OGC78515.1 MAG: hypothetical protein A2852_02065 [Candidatus Adlerbacteria bacterium RIFCSPHIGHO2_01_FULL_54_23]
MFIDKETEQNYILENYPEVTDSRLDDNHWDLFCSTCNIVRGFQVVRKAYTADKGQYSTSVNWDAPRTVYFKCPVCGTYKFWILFRLSVPEVREDGQTYSVERWYKVTSIPNDGSEEIEELPDEPASLRTAYRQAVRAMDANAHIAAAAMFRRALQVITREILKATPGNLANELQAVVGTKYNGVTVSQDFSDVGYIIKEAGNQGAHPDDDPDLLDFTQQDAEDLQNIFMELVSELFVVPEAKRKAKDDFLKRRKIKT